MKGAIQPDHIPVNKFRLIVPELIIPLTPVEISGLEETLQTIDLPDRTRASGGDSEAIEFDMVIPAHHIAEQAAMEVWFLQSKEPIAPNYKKAGSLIMSSLSGAKVRSFSMIGLFPVGRGTPDLDLSNEGEMASITWKMSVDTLLPV